VTTSRSRHTSKWVFSKLTSLGMRPARGKQPLELLEVGAVNTQLLSVPWLAVRAIDLKSCHPRIEEKNFFDLRPEYNYGAVVCSMVINCVPSPEARGRMLKLLHQHVCPGGLVFLTLPLRCLTHSKNITWEQFAKVIESVGFVIESSKASPKVAFFCLQKPKTGEEARRPPPSARGPPEGILCGKGPARATSTFGVTLRDEAELPATHGR